MPSDTESQTISPIRLEEVYLNNEDLDEHVVDIVIQRNSTVAYWNTIRLNGTDAENSAEVSHGETIESGAIGTSLGRYVVFVRLDNQTSGKRFTVNQLVENCSSVSLQVEIRDKGDVVLLRGGSCD